MGLPKQAYHAREDAQANRHQPQGRSIPPPCPIHDDQANDPRYAPQQDRTRPGRSKRLQCFDGCPPPFDIQKKFKVTAALKEVRCLPGRKIASLGRLCHEVGWQYKDCVERLEAKRLANAQEWYNKCQAKEAKKAAQAKKANTAEIDAKLAAFGY